MVMSTCLEGKNEDMLTDTAAIEVAKTSYLVEASMHSLEGLIQQDGNKVDDRSTLPIRNARNSECTTSNILSSSVAGSCTLSQLASCQNTEFEVPFVKSSHWWEAIEAIDVFKELPQRPHFLPLREYDPGLREGMALGQMMSFEKLVENVRKSSIGDEMASFEENIKTLCHLEKSGFSSPSLHTALHKFFHIKSAHIEKLREKEDLKAQILDNKNSLSQINLLLDESAKTIEELRREEQQIAQQKEHADEESSRLKTADRHIEEVCGDAENEFQRVMILSCSGTL